MDLTISFEDAWIIVGLSGELDVATVPASRAIIDKTIREHPGSGLVLDLTAVTFMDSSGLGFILGRYRQLEEQGRKTILAGAQGQVRRVLTMSGLDRIVPVHLTLAQAISAIREVK